MRSQPTVQGESDTNHRCYFKIISSSKKTRYHTGLNIKTRGEFSSGDIIAMHFRQDFTSEFQSRSLSPIFRARLRLAEHLFKGFKCSRGVRFLVVHDSILLPLSL